MSNFNSVALASLVATLPLAACVPGYTTVATTYPSSYAVPAVATTTVAPVVASYPVASVVQTTPVIATAVSQPVVGVAPIYSAPSVATVPTTVMSRVAVWP